MALFGLNWEESKWPGHLSSIVLYFFASKISVKLPPEKKVPWHRRGPARARGANCHFCKKNAFFRQKMTFFQKVHFLQKWSVTQNTVFQWFKNNFLLSHPKLVFSPDSTYVCVLLMLIGAQGAMIVITLYFVSQCSQWSGMDGLQITRQMSRWLE